MTLRWLLALGVGAVLLSLPALGGSQSAAEAQGRLIDFSQYHFGAVPDEFAYDATGSHGPMLAAGRPFWRVYTDPSAPSPNFVLIQASTLQKRDHYPLAFLRSFQAADVSLGVFVKLMGGVNASAGILWRAQDKDNYYAALASARTGQVSVLAMKHGRPFELASAPCPIEVEFERLEPSPTRGWYLLEVFARGNHHTIRFQGQRLLDVEDATFSDKGQVGLITYSNTVALFDNFAVQTGTGRLGPMGPAPEMTDPPVMHVAAISVTDASFKQEVSGRAPGQSLYWTVRIEDSSDKPVPGAYVKAEVLCPNGSVLSNETGMTGSDGIVLFTLPLQTTISAGRYTVKVSSVRSGDFPDAPYAAAANVTSAAAFLVW